MALMITKCRFCSYNRRTKLNRDIIYLMQDTPPEDYTLWIRRLIGDYGMFDYHSVKIHMGKKHKAEVYKYIEPEHIFEEAEKAYINQLAGCI